MKAIMEADYFCLEVHFYSVTGDSEVKEQILKALKSFEKTHHCIRDHVTFSARNS
jgi:hypothetical protein